MKPFFGLLNWSVIPERDEQRAWPGSPPHPQRAYVKVLLIRINEHFEYTTRLRDFLVKHPALVIRMGFRPLLDETQPYGFDVERTVPCARHLRRKLLTLDNDLLQGLLGGTVHTLQAEIPEAGDSVATDVKHLYAWVRENNPREHIPNRFDPQRQPRGDSDCKLGVKESHNQGQAVSSNTTLRVSSPSLESAESKDGRQKESKEYLWGYGTGLSVARHATYGEFVLAEQTRPFNLHDSQYYFPLMQQTRARLGHGPKRLSADAAFDAWYIYEDVYDGGGKAFIPFNTHGLAYPTFGPHGQHLCADGREMVGLYPYYDRTRGYHAEVEKCPLLFGEAPPDETCHIQHPQFIKGVGCVKYRNLEIGAQLRVALDRQSDEYDTAYNDRTAAERINSQAKAFGIERPKLRRIRSIRNQNTLIYLIINLKAIQRVRATKAQARSP